ncbi:MAG: metal-dependent transcriptional regulator [Anaerolineales bacterium]|nr:metal-dependent transcriptional regulator [Anaerolineales bacterium]
MRENLTHAIEDYLKAIYELTSTEGRASTNDLAEQLDVRPASVSGMIKKLSETEPPLVEYEKHRGVILTPEGQKVALEIIRHHRLLELYLHQMLGYPWDKVHDEADRLEHVISEEFEARIAAALGDPLHDPHGDPIPTIDLTLPPSTVTPLNQLRPGDHAIIRRVRDTDADLLCFLEDRGLVPQIEIEVVEYSPFDDNLTLQIEGQAEKLVLGPRITGQVFVDRVK